MILLLLSHHSLLPPTRTSPPFLSTKSRYKPATLKETPSFCLSMKQAITTGGVTYREQPWHKECFVCTGCKKQLSGQRFTSRDEFAYCLSCFCNLYAKKCAGCTNPISGRFQGLQFFFQSASSNIKNSIIHSNNLKDSRHYIIQDV